MVHRDVAPVTKLASALARKTIRDALSSGLQILLGDGGCGSAVRSRTSSSCPVGAFASSLQGDTGPKYCPPRT